MPVRPAATVVLVRDGDEGPEVLMLRRNLSSIFVAGAYVFPGGALEPDDGDPEDMTAYKVAAIRECFEESGVLLAAGPGGRVLSLADPDVAARFDRHRADVDAGRRAFADVCAEEGLTPLLDDLRYLSRWVTPEGAPRRYDTRFFVARAPDEQTPLHDDREAIESLWIRPADALARNRTGDFELILPTMETLASFAAD